LSDLTLFLKKKFWSALFTAFLFLSCSSTDLERNPYLAEYSFQFPINLNLPEYNDLKLAGGSVLISQLGHKGVIVYNINGIHFWLGKRVVQIMRLVVVRKSKLVIL